MARVALDAEVAAALRSERVAGYDSDAVVALLAIERDVLVAQASKALERERIIGTLRFLQAEHVGTGGLEEFRHQVDAQPHRIDVPGGDFQLHDNDARSLEPGIAPVTPKSSPRTGSTDFSHMHSHSVEAFTHDHHFLGERHHANERRAWMVVLVTAAMMVAEIAVGALSGSMALLADGWHMATHAAAIGG